jgi:high-affinity iron transporter
MNPGESHSSSLKARLAGLALLVGAILMALAPPASAATGSGVTKAEALDQLQVVRSSIDRTLELIKSGRADQAFAEAKRGYLSHFEYVEIPLRAADPTLTADAETKFAEIRGLISTRAPVAEVRDNIVQLRRLIDEAERRLTDKGVAAPAVIAGQSFLIIFREGLEAVLLISVLMSYLEAAKATKFRKPILMGMGLAIPGSILTFLVIRIVLRALPFGREMLEAVTTIAAVLVLFYISFWLLARLESKRWMEFVKTRLWNAVSVGSSSALMLVGFTAVYREAFESALLYQALLSFGEGLGGWVAVGLAIGAVVLAVVAYGILRLGRKMPTKAFLSVAVSLLMVTSVAFLGNAVRALQQADVVRLTVLKGWPHLPIFLSQALGYWPSAQTVGAQAVLSSIYLAAGFWALVVRPRRNRRHIPPPPPAQLGDEPFTALPAESPSTPAITTTRTQSADRAEVQS